MSISKEILEQLAEILKSHPTPYRSVDYPDLELAFEVWAWPLPNSTASTVRQLIQQERERINQTGGLPDFPALISKLPSDIQSIMQKLGSMPIEDIYAQYPSNMINEVNDLMFTGFERTIEAILTGPKPPNAKEPPAKSQAIALLQSKQVPHYVAGLNLVIVDSLDVFDILRVEQTAGENYDLDNEAIIAQLNSWEKQFGLQILKASSSGVTIQFRNLPRNSKKLRQELIAFCPDMDEVSHQDLKVPLDLWWD
ncbi:MAG: DUF4253 domain-containing protein [Anaerolineales bacterium]|nr:DUF4253 domain-containing protein [Anaerolineales bacterium]